MFNSAVNQTVKFPDRTPFKNSVFMVFSKKSSKEHLLLMIVRQLQKARYCRVPFLAWLRFGYDTFHRHNPISAKVFALIKGGLTEP
ncbi:protein of unknown function [Candidatus Nitrotoga arctica]|uniref:Transposase n=1 Tax=Candidatus Nitrotoga arctica TaxID=453162 RepID=A0ABM8Z083_9PROT|nr:protein of unknown function [Candidatus Nitrotoga arctica]